MSKVAAWSAVGLGVSVVLVSSAAVCASAANGSGPTAVSSQIVFAANRSPRVNGEIYRVDPDGTSVDLSDSAGLDIDPSVSPDGKRVAFLSTRGGHIAVYVVGTDGRGRRRVSPLLWDATPSDGLGASFAWTADSRRFAVAITVDPREGGLYVDGVAGWRTLAPHVAPIQSVTWSRDGGMLAYTTSDSTVHVIGPTGRRLWTVVGIGPPAWGNADRLAVSTLSTTIGVYDRSGHELTAFLGKSFAWSPSGSVLAVLNGKRLQLRRGGVGKPLLDVRVAHALPLTFGHGFSWVGNGRLLIYGNDGWIGYDVAHKRPWPLPRAIAIYNGIFLPDGAIAYWQPQPGGVDQLTLLPTGTGPARVLTTITNTCGEESPSWTQAVPHSRSLVYQSACGDPSADLYDINPDGSGLRQLTNTPTDERQPSISPDGSSIVYVQQQVVEGCDGCVQTLWRVSADGGTPEQLTAHADQDTLRFDAYPSWSPDGQQIAFLRDGFDAPGTLYVIPATGGAARRLRVEGYEPVWGPQRIAYVSPDANQTVKTFDPANGITGTVGLALGPNATAGPLAWAPDGRLAYLVYDADGNASIVTAHSVSKPIALGPLLTPGAEVQGLAWSPDGTRFAFVATDANGIGEVYTIGTDGKNLTRLTRNVGAVGNLSWGSGR